MTKAVPEKRQSNIGCLSEAAKHKECCLFLKLKLKNYKLLHRTLIYPEVEFHPSGTKYTSLGNAQHFAGSRSYAVLP